RRGWGILVITSGEFRRRLTPSARRQRGRGKARSGKRSRGWRVAGRRHCWSSSNPPVAARVGRRRAGLEVGERTQARHNAAADSPHTRVPARLRRAFPGGEIALTSSFVGGGSTTDACTTLASQTANRCASPASPGIHAYERWQARSRRDLSNGAVEELLCMDTSSAPVGANASAPPR